MSGKHDRWSHDRRKAELLSLRQPAPVETINRA
jgi:hypothetical protein